MADTSTTAQRHQQPHASDDDIDFGYLFGLLLDNKWLILGTALFALMLGTLYGMLATPIYKGDTLLQIEKKSSGVPGLSELNQIFEQEASAAAEIEILRSRMVLGEVIEQLKMNIQVLPDRTPFIGRFMAADSAPAFVPKPLFAGYRDSETFVTVSSFTVPERLQGRVFTLREENGNQALYQDDDLVASSPVGETLKSEDGGIQLQINEWQLGNESLNLVRLADVTAINGLRSALSIQEVGKTGMLSLQMTGPNKQRIKTILDAISEAYLLQNVKRRSAEAENSLEFLGDQLPKIKDKLTEFEEKLNAYRLQSESVDLSMETQSVLQQSVDIEAKINELKAKEGELATRFTKEHPAYQSLLRQKASLIEQKRSLDSQIKDLPETQQEILRLMRDVEVTQQIYVGLLNKTQELRILKAGTVGSVRIIDKALVQPSPIKPKKALIAVIAMMLGGMGAAGIVLLRALLNKGIESPDKLEEQGVAVYATVPLSEKQVKANRLTNIKQRRTRDKKIVGSPIALLALDDPTDLAIEALRSLRTSLHFAMMDADNKILMITGPSPEVGKSFVSANLGVVLAQTGQRVLVIDADMRKGHLHRYFQAASQPGLSTYLSGQSSKEDIIQSSIVDKLDFIARGKAPPNPSELLMHERFKTLMDSLSDDYDLILVDTPPILAVTDAAIVGQLAGSSLLVTRFGLNSIKEVDAALTRFAQNKVDIKGAILNCMERRATNEYGYYAYEYGKSTD
ncbi:MAG: tyrosine-protein kinase [Alcanivorax sp.]|uniref:polysaccharide biosynthesis tyrosine autokinase n=1 Tax=unclassified Alcanivorax TaxID=2638842 RepID=UPI000C8F9AF7|nr:MULTISPECIES: polysaccharide biosynthesis tyrosine autokinase [unclassified Alcanivorax]MAC15846.1 tyrosine-protein kinase [Alcanivorax sp.]|tara:strand:- start:3148 stop:5367 length:2220 start_codon:yes stop_codon:yes gene_type:complete